MGSKWINNDLFAKYVDEKAQEVTNSNQLRRSDFVWTSPKAGTVEKAKVYEGRFLPDKKGKFTKKYMYHMWKSGDKWIFHLCEKTFGIDNFCPICAIVSALYTGTSNDKAVATKMKRKERHVGNFYVVDDPRDNEIDDEAKKANGKVKLYEFPSKLESKLKNELLDKKEGLGFAIFDPGSEGHNVIIKIKSTKPDKNGNTYPDYSDSVFSRKSHALSETDTDIKKIMESTYDIDEYIESLRTTKDDTIKLLKNEMLWDLIENEWNRHYGIKVNDTVIPESNDTQEEDVPESVTDDSVEDEEDKELSDDDLLEELRKLK